MEREKTSTKFLNYIKERWQPMLMLLLPLILVFVFCYIPITGILIAFKDCKPWENVFNSKWASDAQGNLDLFKYFKIFFSSSRSFEIIRNTFCINVINLLVSFTVNIIFALLLNELSNMRFKKVVQTITYLPHFISWIIFAGLMNQILDTDVGIVNIALKNMHLIKNGINFLYSDSDIWGVAVVSNTIKGLGWSTIIYIAALSSVDEQLIDAASLDGANRFQKIWYINLPCLLPTVMLQLVFSIGGLFNSNFDQMFVLKNDLNKNYAEVINTYVYEIGINDVQSSYATAIGLMTSLIGLILLFVSNKLAKVITGNSVL